MLAKGQQGQQNQGKITPIGFVLVFVLIRLLTGIYLPAMYYCQYV